MLGKEKTGRYAFLAGLALSVLLAIIQAEQAAWLTVLVAVIVAALNIQTRETVKMLLWTIGMGVFGFGALVSGLSTVPALGETLAAIVTNIGTFFMTIAGVFLLKIGYTMFSK